MFKLRVTQSVVCCALGFLFPICLIAEDLILGQYALVTDDVNGNLIVTNGAPVIARDVRVHGSVIVENGASFYGLGVRVDGNVQAKFANSVTLKEYDLQKPQVLGNVEIKYCSGGLRLFDAQIAGHVLFQENFAYDIAVRGSVVNGDIQAFYNFASRIIVINNNTVFGNIQTSGNDPSPVFYNGNSVAGPPADGSLIEIMAAGDEGDEQFYLQIDGQPVRRWTAPSEQQAHYFKAADTVTADQVRIEFVNDLYDPGRIDRNLVVDYLSIDGAVHETEAPTVYSTGTWFPSNGVIPGYHETETLHVNGYFQYGLPGSFDYFVRHDMNEILPDGWTFDIFNDGANIYLRSFDVAGNGAFDLRFGAAGAIADIEDARTRKDLLAPSYQGEVTDRVAQWTMWETGQTVQHYIPWLPAFEHRFNMTQAGNFAGELNGTVDVNLFETQGQLDVWAVVDKQWKSELQPYIDCTITGLTRFNALDNGALLVRRVVRVGAITLNGRQELLDIPYFEAWNPFSDHAFNSMALGIDSQGIPNHWYADSYNIPFYQYKPVEQTRGWAMAYNRWNLSSGATIAVVFGRNPGQVHLADGTTADPHGFVFNSMDFPGGLAILPGLWTGTIPPGSIIDQSYLLVPSQGIRPGTGAMLDALSAVLPAPRVYHPGAILDFEFSVIADRLENLTSEPRTETASLGLLDLP